MRIRLFAICYLFGFRRSGVENKSVFLFFFFLMPSIRLSVEIGSRIGVPVAAATTAASRTDSVMKP